MSQKNDKIFIDILATSTGSDETVLDAVLTVLHFAQYIL